MVQHIRNEFWNRWHKEFLATLQERQKWLVSRRNFYIGDVVLLKEYANRNEWKMAKVIIVYTDEKVQSACKKCSTLCWYVIS